MHKTTIQFSIRIKSISILGILFMTFTMSSQNDLPFVREVIYPTEPVCTYYPSESVGLVSVLRSQKVIDKMERSGAPCSTFVVTYNGFTPQAEAAFQYAVDIWSFSIESPVPINIIANFSALGPGVLGSAGPVNYTTTNAPGAVPNTFYPKALVEKLEGMDSSPFGGSNDINANFSSTANFYFGIDANPPGGQIDFVSVVLHELGHGLGFAGFADTDGFTGSIRFNTRPSIYDRFIENGTGAAILSFADPSAALHTEFTSSSLFCNSTIAQGQNGGVKPKIYAPSPWDQGSSYSHWDEATFGPGDIHSLMSPQIGPGEANHNPGPITLAFFESMGWSICGGSLSVNEFSISSVEVSPNPFKSAITIKLANGLNDDYTVNLIDINGRLILSESKSVRNNTITLSNLDQLEDALYFIKIINKSTGAIVTKKVIKN